MTALFMLALLPMFGAQQIENTTKLQVIGYAVTEHAIFVQLRNAYPAALLGVTLSRGAVLETIHVTQPSQKIAPQQTFDFRFPVERAELEGQLLVIRAVLLEDGTGDGDTALTQVMISRLAGLQDGSRMVLQAFEERRLEAIESANPEPHGTEQQRVAYANGYLGVKKRALREIKLRKDRKELAEDSAEFRTYFENALRLHVNRRAQ